ncbi:MAG: hypothetical protein ACRCUP_04905 [Mycoplasmatales bacterium]
MKKIFTIILLVSFIFLVAIKIYKEMTKFILNDIPEIALNETYVNEMMNKRLTIESVLYKTDYPLDGKDYVEFKFKDNIYQDYIIVGLDNNKLQFDEVFELAYDGYILQETCSTKCIEYDKYVALNYNTYKPLFILKIK